MDRNFSRAGFGDFAAAAGHRANRIVVDVVHRNAVFCRHFLVSARRNRRCGNGAAGFCLRAASTCTRTRGCVSCQRRIPVRASAKDPFVQLACAGLAAVTGLQAFINMGVSLSILPAKGMTLPFISYGGSSLFAVALTMGFALGLTRHRPVLPDEVAI